MAHSEKLRHLINLTAMGVSKACKIDVFGHSFTFCSSILFCSFLNTNIFDVRSVYTFQTLFPSPSQSKFNILSMVMGTLMGNIGLETTLPVKLPVTIGTMLNFDGDCDVDRDGVGKCKQTFTVH